MKQNSKATIFSGLIPRLILTAIFGGVYFYVMLPAINLKAPDFWAFLIILVLFYIFITLLTSGARMYAGGNVIFMSRTIFARCKMPLILLGVLCLAAVIGAVYSSEIFHAKEYYNLLDVQTGDFTEEVAEISYDKIPMLDKDSSVQLGSRALGSLSSSDSNLVSQFEVSDLEYSQINYQNNPVRVAPLLYGNLIKWFNNRADGLPGYIIVNMVTQEADLVKLDEGMKYSTGEHFGRNLYRLLRFRYPTMMFGDVNFEIDEDGTPWWVCSRTVRTIGLFGGEDTQGAVLVNAITGESTYYEEVPTWVDRVYSADQLVAQYNYHGTLVNGWINSWLGQKGVTTTSDGYNYIAMNDDVYLYTGVTSAGNDESNVGFILVNQRTKEARYYSISGATEYSAMSSAEGAVQHLGYEATFPILLNISEEPTYFMSLKDSAQLVKMYAMVNVKDYQITATGSSVAECQANYEALLLENGVKVTDPLDAADIAGTDTVIGKITEIRTVVVDGNTIFYFRLGSNVYYAVSAADDQDAVIFDVGDRVTITYYAEEETNGVYTGVTVNLSTGSFGQSEVVYAESGAILFSDEDVTAALAVVSQYISEKIYDTTDNRSYQIYYSNLEYPEEKQKAAYLSSYYQEGYTEGNVIMLQLDRVSILQEAYDGTEWPETVRYPDWCVWLGRADADADWEIIGQGY